MATAKTVVVTGGAGGMGLAICKRLAKRGSLILADINREKLEQARFQLSREGIEDAEFIECDVSNKKQVEELADAVRKTGVLDSCIHTAAYSPVQQEPRRLLEVNTIGTVNVIDAFYPLMFNGSSMITITSVAGHFWQVDEASAAVFQDAHSPELLDKLMDLLAGDMQKAYPLSKSFCMYYSKQSTARYAKKGARILTLSCGCFTTPMGLADMMGGEYVISSTPIARWGHPDEIAAVVEFMSSEEASYITGVDLLVDGGYDANIRCMQYEQYEMFT